MATIDGAAPAAEGRLDFTAKLVILLSGILSALCLTAINSVLPSIARDLAHSPTDALLVKQLIGGVTLAMAAGAPLGGYLADKIGLRPTLFAAALLYTLAGTAGLYLNSLPLLLASRLLLGLSAATIQVLGLTMVNVTLSGNARARWMGLHVSVAIFGTLFVHPLAGQLGEISWRLPFILYATGAVLVVGLLLGRRHSAPQAMPTPADKAAAAAAGPGILAWFPWHYLPLSFLLGAMTYLPTISIPFQLRQQAGATPSTIGYVLTGTAAVGAVMAFLYGPARRRLSVHTAFLIGLGVAGTGALIAASASSFAGVLGGLLLHSLGVAWFVPNIMTALGSKVTKEQQGRAAGMVRAAHFLSAPVGVILIQPFVKQFGEVVAMQVVAVIGFTLFVVMALRTVTARAPRPAPAE
jgi:MFS family permease